MASSCLFRANMSECPNFHHTSSPFHLYYGSPQKPVNILSVQLSTSAMFMAQHALSFLPTFSSFLTPHFNGLAPDSGFCLFPQRFHCPTNLCRLPYYLFYVSQFLHASSCHTFLHFIPFTIFKVCDWFCIDLHCGLLSKLHNT